jgi:hypothetical protein
MPNWVYNSLSITDPSGEHCEDVTRLMEQVGATYTTVQTSYEKTDEGMTVSHKEVEVADSGFSFWNIKRPEGEDLATYNESIGASGAMPFWYDWNCEHWGTKWDASDVDIQDYAADHKQITFSTPWSPPIPVLTALSEQYPNIHIELEWEEEQGFGGTFTFTNGEPTETDYYDIPSSHADYVARDRECGCETWADEAPFEDCPTYVPEPSPDMLIPNDELELEAVL